MSAMLLQTNPLDTLFEQAGAKAPGRACRFSVFPFPTADSGEAPPWLALLERRTAIQAEAARPPKPALHLDELHGVLCGLNFMADLPGELRVKIASILINIGSLRRAQAGEIWMREHDRNSGDGYVLLGGRARVQRTEMPDGICPAPELMGESMQFNPLHERTATVIAASECLVLRFAWQDFWARVAEVCSGGEQHQVRTALENLAWDHLTRPLHIPSHHVHLEPCGSGAGYAAAQPSAMSR